jgi:hypothetical protein
MAKNVKVLNVLRAARGLIVKGWNQNALAEDKMGNDVPVNSDRAVSFCAVGALRRAEFNQGTKGVAAKARRVLRSVLPKNATQCGSVMLFNDYAQNKRQVLKLFDRAIAKVSK